MKTTRMGSTAVLATAILGLGALASGCGLSTKAGDGFHASADLVAVTTSQPGASPAGSTPTTVTGPGAPTSTPTPPASPVPVPTTGKPPTTKPAPATPVTDRCTAEGLELRTAALDDEKAMHYNVVILTNRSGKTCKLRGYPGVSLLDYQGRSMGEADRNWPAPTTGEPPQTITLAPGRAAHAVLATHFEEAVDGCNELQSSTEIMVIPPDDTGRLRAPFVADRCIAKNLPFHISELTAED